MTMDRTSASGRRGHCCWSGGTEGRDPIAVGPVLGLLVGILVSCANPQAPSGGPRDRTPPSVVRTRPAQDTVNVSTDTEALRVEFSEYIERSTLSQSLSVTPTFEQRLQFSWDGQAVEIQFPSALRDSTTYIFTFDTNLSDARGVSREDPATVAFSTGKRINRGQIEGRVVDGRRGTARQGVDVFAYTLPPGADTVRPLPDAPGYRTQTGEEGRFSFEYMREGPYYVLALRDDNRNRQPDPQEPVAVPPRRSLLADSGAAAAVPVAWLLARRDTTGPQLQQVRPVSQRRLRLRFDEPVRVETRAPTAWAPRDSATGTSVPVRGVYSAPDRSNAVVVRTDAMPDARHVLPLRRGAVVDTLGQPLRPDTVRFRAATRADTVRTRFRGFASTGLGEDSTGAHLLLPDVQPRVRFTQVPDSAALRTGVSVQDTTGTPRAVSLATDNGTSYRLQPDPSLSPGQIVDVTIAGSAFARPDTTFRRRFRCVTDRVLGALAGRARIVDTTRADGEGRRRGRDTPAVPSSPTFADSVRTDSLTSTRDSLRERRERPRRDSLLRDGPIAVELTAVESSTPGLPRQLITSPDSLFEFVELPDGRYRFRAYLDRNENGRWDGGRVQPYVPAEPVTWLREPLEVRPRWTTELPAPLRIPVLMPAPVPRDTTLPDTSGTAGQDR
ncbi:Ig-like domain-containing protein [Salinibacter altiplanensis]|uniref:Ig-like domain-containing protein n=1 Tax=Salinibacter altiplanensis TaxID=1803181 RepID=UPI003C6E14BE